MFVIFVNEICEGGLVEKWGVSFIKTFGLSNMAGFRGLATAGRSGDKCGFFDSAAQKRAAALRMTGFSWRAAAAAMTGLLGRARSVGQAIHLFVPDFGWILRREVT
jgi:hypothetical protein